jgi:O-antigen/teichoic acid export membrane protein
MSPSDDPSESCAEGRRRSWRVGHNAVAQGLAKGISGLSQLVLVPLLLGHLGTDTFGWVMTLFTITGLIAFADFGVVIALQQRLAEAWGRRDLTDLRNSHASGARLLTKIGWGWFAAGVIFARWIGPAILPAPAAIDLAVQRIAWLCVAGTIATGVATGAGQRLALAMQTGWLTAVWTATINVTMLVSAIVAVRSGAGAPVFLALLGLGGILPGIIVGIQITRQLGWKSGINPAPAEPEIAVRLWREGLRYAPPHLAGALLNAATAPVVVHFGGWGAGAALALLLRLFGPITQAHALLLGPLWPAYAEAMVRQDRAWILRTVRVSFLFTVAGVVALLTVTAGLPIILPAIAGNSTLVPAATLVWLVAGWQAATMLQQPLGVLLLGHNRLGRVAGHIAAVHLTTLGASIVCGSLWAASGVISALLIGTAFGLIPVLLTESVKTLRAA